MRLPTLVGLLVLTIARGSSAAAPPSCAAPEHRQFDFWLGSWDIVERGAARPSATADVTAELGGCVIREIYHDDSGLQGESLSSYDAKDGQWQQTWVTNRGQLLVIHGKWSGSGLSFQGWIRELGTETLVRATWSPEAGGVRETADRSTDGGRTWTPWFDLSFRRQTPKGP